MGKLKVPIELSEARLAACRVWPEASHVIMSMVPVESPGLAQRAAGSICVDQYWRLYFDPQAFLERSVVQRIATILHETAHLLGRHHVRAKRYVAPDDRQAWFDWNCACDMAVWGLIKAAGMPVPETAVTAERAGFSENLSAEQYFRLIRDKREQERQQAQEQAEQDEQENQGDSDGNDSQEPDDGDGAGDSQASDEDSDQSDDQSESDSQGDQAGESGEGQSDDGSDSDAGSQDDADESGSDSDDGSDGGNAGMPQPGAGVEGGSCADGVARDWELPAPQGDDSAASQADKQEDTPPVVEQWKQEILLRNAADRLAASGKGSGSGMWREMVEHYQEPKLDPRRLLQKTLSRQLGNLQAGCGRFTYRRPARRPSLGGTLRPRSFQPVPRILVIIDTSGSMSSEEMRLGVGLVSKCINALRLQDGVRVMAGDDMAQWDEQCFNPRHISLIGGGGTDMACLIEAAASKPQRERPELIVVVTDGETGWPKTRVAMPVVVALTRDSEYARFFPVPDWMESVKLY